MFWLLISPVSLRQLFAYCSKVVILLLLVHCVFLLPFCVWGGEGGCVWSWFCDKIKFFALYTFEIILLRKRELIALLKLNSDYFYIVSVCLCSDISSSWCHGLVCDL